MLQELWQIGLPDPVNNKRKRCANHGVKHRAVGVVVSHPLSMREALGSIPRLSKGSTPQGTTKKQGRRDGPAPLRREQHEQHRGALLCLPYAIYKCLHHMTVTFCPSGQGGGLKVHWAQVRVGSSPTDVKGRQAERSELIVVQRHVSPIGPVALCHFSRSVK